MRGKIAIVVSLTFLCWAGALLADEVLLGQIYGTGVHSFNQGDYVGAYNALTSAIKGGSNDPRAYYFRGLAYLKLGRDDEAKADFAKGAELEVADSVNEFPVNRSLERIQGRPRQLLEYYRMTVHAVAVQRQETARQARYEQRAAAEQDVLRRVAPAQLPAGPATPVPSIPPQAEKAVNPFEPGAEPAPAAAKPAMEVEKSPFEVPAPAQKPAEKPAAEAPDASPFGTPTPPATKEGNDPFATPPQAAPKATTPKPAPAEGGDPFGNPVPAPATEKPAEPAANPSSANTTDNSKTVEPTIGGIGSLFNAFVAGSQTSASPADAAAAAPPMGFEDFVKGMMGGAAGPPAVGQQGAVPAPGGAQPAMTQPAAAQPAAADDPFGPAAAPTAPAPAGGVPAPNGNVPAPMPANQAAPPATQVPPPANDNDPFK